MEQGWDFECTRPNTLRALAAFLLYEPLQCLLECSIVGCRLLDLSRLLRLALRFSEPNLASKVVLLGLDKLEEVLLIVLVFIEKQSELQDRKTFQFEVFER